MCVGEILRRPLVNFGLATLATGPAFADEHEIAAYGAVLDACYADRTDYAACIGEMSTTCMETEDGGETTLGMTICLSAEGQVWDRHLNAEYQATLAFFKKSDADEAVHFPEFAKRVEKLRAAQRAWITFRDASCSLAYAEWGSGSMRNIAAADCAMVMTAERTIELRQMRETF